MTNWKDYQAKNPITLELLDSYRDIGPDNPNKFRTGSTAQILDLLAEAGPLDKKEISKRLERNVTGAVGRLIRGWGLVSFDYSDKSKGNPMLWLRDPEHFRQIRRNDRRPINDSRIPCNCRDCIKLPLSRR